jgi:hypothetical protein
MISHEVTQRNIWPYMIVLGLIVMAFLLGWLASGALQTAGLQVNDNIASPAENVPAAPMFYFKERGTPGLAPAAVESNIGADPAEPLLYFKERGTAGLAPITFKSTQGVEPAEISPAAPMLYFKERGTPGLAPTISESK